MLPQVCNEDEKSVACVSRTLTKAERSYSQLKIEELALILGNKEVSCLRIWHQPQTNAEPSSVNPSKFLVWYLHTYRGSWALMLALHRGKYTIKYESSSINNNFNPLSCLPLPMTSTHMHSQ